jgi:hypothetical protein
MDANSTLLMVGEIKAGWGTFMDDATASAWRRELAPMTWADADRILKRMMDAGVKPTLAEFRSRVKSAKSDGYRAKVESTEYEICDTCGSRGYVVLILCGQHYDQPVRIADSRDTCPATMQRYYWTHRIPCAQCRRGDAYCGRWHASLKSNMQRWESLAKRAMTWAQGTYLCEFYQHCSEHHFCGAPMPDRYYPERQTQEQRKIATELSEILQRTLTHIQEHRQ